MSSSHTQGQLSFLCQLCYRATEDIKCSHCDYFSPRTDYNFFDLFKSVRTLELNLAQLQQRYYALQQMTHPDQLQSFKISERLKATALNQVISQAYHVLRDPLQRAKYLFDYQESEETIIDMDLLSSVMTLQDELSILQTLDEYTLFKDKIQSQFDIYFNYLKTLNINDKVSALKSIHALSYLEKLLAQIAHKINHQPSVTPYASTN